MDITLISGIMGLVGALIGALISAIISVILAKRYEKSNKTEDILYDVYMNLLDLNSYYIWIVSNEMQNIENDINLKTKIRRLAWTIADDIRKIDHSTFVQEILDVLMANDIERYPTASHRQEALSRILDKLGQKVNPNYSSFIKEISWNNVKLFGTLTLENRKSQNAPGTFN